MRRAFGLVLVPLLCALGSGSASGFTEKGLSLLGYQLCNYTVTRQVPRVEAVRTPHLTFAPCGGWIPWRRCPKTVYRTRYREVVVPESRHVMDCCEGFEQLGLYCVLHLNRSLEFASRPGVCPTVGWDEPPTPCVLDMDCPGLWKCCPLPGGLGCVAPEPPALQGAPGTSWYNVTFLVKMSFADLRAVDPQLRNHARLLHALVTSALWPLACTVHPLHSAAGDPATTLSRLLLGLGRPLPVSTVSAALAPVVKRVYEVIRIGVQDVDECVHEELCACAAGQLCENSEGSHRCWPEPPAPRPQEPGSPAQDCPPVTDTLVSNVTGTSFRLSWDWGSACSRPACVQLFQGSRLLRTARPWGTALEVAGLEAGVVYGVTISCPDCGTNSSATLTVRTGGAVNPAGAVQTPVAPAVGPETPVLVPSVGPARGVPASGEPQTPGPLPGNSTDQRVRAALPSGAPGTGTGPATAHRVPDSGVSWTLEPAHSPRQGSPHWLSPSPTTGVPLQPTRPEGPTGPETRLSSPATWALKPQDSDLGPSGPSALPQRAPTCVPGALGTVTVSNVSSSGFHAAWVADLALSPTFHITLTSPRGRREHLETPDAKVTLVGLEPGALYLVDIVAEACGAESPRVQLRVRTGDPPATVTGTPESPPSTVGAAGSASVPGLAPRLSLAAAVSILCDIQKLGVAIQRRFLQQESVPESSLYLGHPACGVTQSNSTHVLLVAGWGQCGTVVQSNLSSTEVRTTLRSGPSAGGVIHHPRVLSPVHCTFRNHLLVSSSYTPQWGELAVAGDLHGTGHFATEMQVFVGDSPVLPNHSVSARAHVRVQVGLRPRQAGLCVVLLECWATPSHDAADPRAFGFINNSCPVPNCHTDLLENGASDRAGFRLKIFSFVDDPLVFLHCRLRVCLDSPPAACRIDCSDVRTPRTGNSTATHQASWGPLVRADGEAPAVRPGLGVSSLVLAVVAASAAVIGVAVLLVQRCRRVTSRRFKSVGTEPR